MRPFRAVAALAFVAALTACAAGVSAPSASGQASGAAVANLAGAVRASVAVESQRYPGAPIAGDLTAQCAPGASGSSHWLDADAGRPDPDRATDATGADELALADAVACVSPAHARLQSPHADGTQGANALRFDRGGHRALQLEHAGALARLERLHRLTSTPRASGHRADRPTIVTRPLRGPPAVA